MEKRVGTGQGRQKGKGRFKHHEKGEKKKDRKGCGTPKRKKKEPLSLDRREPRRYSPRQQVEKTGKTPGRGGKNRGGRK